MPSFAHRRSAGNFVAGVSISDYQFLGVLSLDEAIQYGLSRPSVLEDAKARELKRDPDLFDSHEVRRAVQRRFDAARRKRAASYAVYLDGLAAGTILGGVPPLTLYCDSDAAAAEGGLLLRLNSKLVAIDGETQTEARFIRRGNDPDTAREAMAVTLYHGISPEHAASIMHDFNYYAHPVKEKAVAPYNSNGAITKAVTSAIIAIGLRNEEILRVGSRMNKTHVTSFDRMLAGAAGCVAPATVVRKGGLGQALEACNGGAGVSGATIIQPFLAHAVSIALQDRKCATTPPAMWAIAGALSAQRGADQLITLNEWQDAATLFADGGKDKVGRAAQLLGVAVP